MKKVYLLYDSRYHNNPNRATCLTVSDTLKEAKNDRKTMFNSHDVIVEYDDNNGVLENPKIIE